MMYGNGWGWSAMMFMPLLWILLLGAVIWAAFRFAQPHPDRRSPQDRSVRETPQEILDRRFASGEIDTEAYTRARAQLADRPSDTP